ncbi:beta-galactosidase [uncultured Victivallis sp.]|uniref:beta-galactosidase n=1 Tax=uncultured Victivallis sp. TaxID=354118 RepID=UPI0025F5412C|nr:beta-galactosidase [uncultured Victivallis sp.]
MKHFLFFALLALSAGVTAMLKAEDLPLKFSPAVGNPNPEEIFVIPEEDGSFIVAMDTRMRWPRIRFNFAENSPRPTAAHEGICADIENLDPEREYSIEMAFGGAKGLVTIPPGERRTITVYYSLIAPGDDVVKLPRNLPSGAPDGVAGGKNVDPSEINSITLIGALDPGRQRYRISNFRAFGNRPENPAPIRDPERFYPFVDDYGQYIHADWPEKIHSDADFAERRRREEASWREAPRTWDRFGGWADGPQLKATGFFRTEKYRGKWYLVDPEGKLFFSNGVNAVNLSDYFRVTSDEAKAFQTAVNGNHEIEFIRRNLIRKYGREFETVYPEVFRRRMQSWGLNTIGNWSDALIYRNSRTPYTMELRLSGVPWIRNKAKHSRMPDVWDPECRKKIAELPTLPKNRFAVNDPFCIGFFICNEIPFGNRDDVARAIWESPGSAARQEWNRRLREQYEAIEKLNAAWGCSFSSREEAQQSSEVPRNMTAECRADFNRFNDATVEEFFKLCRDTIRRNAPNQLYLGSRLFCNDYFAQERNAIAGKYCDVVSYNIYGYTIAGFAPEGLGDVPVLNTEYHFGVRDRGMFSAELSPAGKTQQDRAAALKDYWRTLLRNPRMVGAHWFLYQDQPLTGRWHWGGENFAVGLVDGTDTPYDVLVNTLRELGETMYAAREETGQ